MVQDKDLKDMIESDKNPPLVPSEIRVMFDNLTLDFKQATATINHYGTLEVRNPLGQLMLIRTAPFAVINITNAKAEGFTQ